MGRPETLAAVREKYPQYADMSDDALGTALAAKYPQYADLAPNAKTTKASGLREFVSGAVESAPPLVGGIADTLGLTTRAGARTPVDVLTKPEGTLEHLARAAIAAPVIYAGGAGAGAIAGAAGVPAGVAAAAPVVGRMLAAGGIGAGESGLKGDSAVYGFLLDAIVAGLTEGTISGVSAVPKVGLKALGAPARGFEWATKAPAKVLEAIKARLPSGDWLHVPSISKKPLPVDQAVKKLSDLQGLKYQQAREEIANEMNRLDMQRLTGPKPLAGQVFKKGTARERYESTALRRARVAESVRGAINDPAIRTAADALTTSEPEIALGAALSVPGFGTIARHAIPHAMVP
jgi:hypothetical protein